MSNFSITKTTKDPLPASGKGLNRIKETVLGKQYDLSLVFIGSKLAKRLNKEHRKKDYPANVLSFPLSDKAGEIFICNELAERQARLEGVSLSRYSTYLFIHGCLHLKGLKHGAKMDAEEEKLRKKFGC